jgi:hypothetical protein
MNTKTWDTSSLFTSLNIVDAEYLPDRKKWVLYEFVCCSDVYALHIADSNNEIVHTHVLSPGSGAFAIDEKRSLVYFTSAGIGVGSSPPRQFLYWLNFETFQLDSLSLENVVTPEYPGEFFPKFLAISADDSLMAITELFRSRMLLMWLHKREIFDTLPTAGEFSDFFQPAIARRYKQ